MSNDICFISQHPVSLHPEKIINAMHPFKTYTKTFCFCSLVTMLLVLTITPCRATSELLLPTFVPTENDTTVHAGQFDNGIRYYVKHNDQRPDKGTYSKRFITTADKQRAVVIVGNIVPDEVIQIWNGMSDEEIQVLETRQERYDKLIKQGTLQHTWDLKYGLPPISRQNRMTSEVLYNEMMLTLIGDMLNVRLLKIHEGIAECPFREANFTFASEMTGLDKEALMLKIKPTKGHDTEALQFVKDKIDFMRYTPFSPMELDNALQQFLTAHQRIYDHRQDMTDLGYIWRISNAVTLGNTISSIEAEWHIFQSLASQVTLEQCNAFMTILLDHCEEKHHDI